MSCRVYNDTNTFVSPEIGPQGCARLASGRHLWFLLDPAQFLKHQAGCPADLPRSDLGGHAPASRVAHQSTLPLGEEGKMGSICHFSRALPASIWRHCSQVLRADFREGDEDSNFSVFRVRRFSEWPEPLH